MHKVYPSTDMAAMYGGQSGSNATANSLLGRPATSKVRQDGDATITTRTIQLSDTARSRTGIDVLVKETVPDIPIAPTTLVFTGTDTSTDHDSIYPVIFGVTPKGKVSDKYRTSTKHHIVDGNGFLTFSGYPAPFLDGGIIFLGGAYNDNSLFVVQNRYLSKDDKNLFLGGAALGFEFVWSSYNGESVLYNAEAMSNLVYRGRVLSAGKYWQLYVAYVTVRLEGVITDTLLSVFIPPGFPTKHTVAPIFQYTAVKSTSPSKYLEAWYSSSWLQYNSFYVLITGHSVEELEASIVAHVAGRANPPDGLGVFDGFYTKRTDETEMETVTTTITHNEGEEDEYTETITTYSKQVAVWYEYRIPPNIKTISCADVDTIYVAEARSISHYRSTNGKLPQRQEIEFGTVITEELYNPDLGSVGVIYNGTYSQILNLNSVWTPLALAHSKNLISLAYAELNSFAGSCICHVSAHFSNEEFDIPETKYMASKVYLLTGTNAELLFTEEVTLYTFGSSMFSPYAVGGAYAGKDDYFLVAQLRKGSYPNLPLRVMHFKRNPNTQQVYLYRNVVVYCERIIAANRHSSSFSHMSFSFTAYKGKDEAKDDMFSLQLFTMSNYVMTLQYWPHNGATQLLEAAAPVTQDSPVPDYTSMYPSDWYSKHPDIERFTI